LHSPELYRSGRIDTSVNDRGADAAGFLSSPDHFAKSYIFRNAHSVLTQCIINVNPQAFTEKTSAPWRTQMRRSSLFRNLSLCLSLTAMTLASSSIAHAQDPGIVVRKADAVARLIRREAYQMRGPVLNQVENALDAILALVRRGRGSHNSNPTSSVCKFMGPGTFQYSTYKYRISLDDKVVEASDSFDTILQKLSQYQDDGLCNIDSSAKCSLLPAGTYQYSTYKYRVSLGSDVVAASDSVDEAINVINSLSQAWACDQTISTVACEIMGEGTYQYSTYKYRVGINGQVYMGSDSYEAMRDFLVKMRNVGACL
jgi:hypothetical protein